KLGIADLLKDGPKTGEELAKPTETDAQSLCRVLRLLASVGVFIEGEDGRFGLTPTAACLQNGPSSSGALPIWWGEECYHAMGDLLYSVKTGKPAFDHVYKMGMFEYLGRNPGGRV
ncbi:MAG TPA: methyltransferase, partial [Terriglobia bacterium]|nr:methyltransferase [Terriglobia bacterium]